MLLVAVLFASPALSVTIGCASGTIPPEEEWSMTFNKTNSDSSPALAAELDKSEVKRDESVNVSGPRRTL